MQKQEGRYCMKITKAWIKKHNPCEKAMKWVEDNIETSDDIEVLQLLVKNDRLDWANWLIVRRMKYKQYVSYAVYAAEQVLYIFEEEYPDDKRPRKAIDAALKCIKNPSNKNKAAAADAADAADAAYAAAAAADAAAAAYAAAYTADAAAAYAAAAAYIAAYTADTAYAAAADARKEMLIKILNYGIELLTNER